MRFELDEQVAHRYLRNGHSIVAEVLCTVYYYDDGWGGTGEFTCRTAIDRTLVITRTRELNELLAKCNDESDGAMVEGCMDYDVRCMIDLNI